MLRRAMGAFAGTYAPPRVTSAPPIALSRDPVLFVHDLSVTYGRAVRWFGRSGASVPTVKGVSFELYAGRTLGLVGESASGRSTTGKAVLGLLPFAGEIVIDAVSIAGLSSAEMKPVRRKAQMIFQHPYASLDPRMSVGAAIAEPLTIHGIGTAARRCERVAMLLKRVHLSPDHTSCYPHEFSGGQRHRICIARALALEPRVIVSDESLSALDVSVRGHVLDLLLELQEEMGLAYLFISHDMAVIERMSNDVTVKRGGEFVENGTRRQVFENPTQEYTKALMRAVPVPIPRRATNGLDPRCSRYEVREF
jgi:peptide/nickel transport system ATP-binding protein